MDRLAALSRRFPVTEGERTLKEENQDKQLFLVTKMPVEERHSESGLAEIRFLSKALGHDRDGMGLSNLSLGHRVLLMPRLAASSRSSCVATLLG